MTEPFLDVVEASIDSVLGIVEVCVSLGLSASSQLV